MAAEFKSGTRWKLSRPRLLPLKVKNLLCLICICTVVHTPEETVIPTGAKAPETTAPAATVATTSSAVSSPEAKTARLVPEQEQVLLRFFGAQDRVDREEAVLLARQVRILVTMLIIQTHSCFVVHVK